MQKTIGYEIADVIKISIIFKNTFISGTDSLIIFVFQRNVSLLR